MRVQKSGMVGGVSLPSFPFPTYNACHRTSLVDAETVFSADQALSTSELPSYLRKLFQRYSHLFMDIPESTSTTLLEAPLSTKRATLLKYLPPYNFRTETICEMLGSTKRKPLAPEVSKLRTIKSESEQNIMRVAADISAKAHAKVSLSSRPRLASLQSSTL